MGKGGAGSEPSGSLPLTGHEPTQEQSGFKVEVSRALSMSTVYLSPSELSGVEASQEPFAIVLKPLGCSLLSPL